MKVRKLLIGLLVVLMAFVFISCEDEPEEQITPQPQPQPAPIDDNTIAKFTVTAGIDGSVWKNEKIGLQWDLRKAFGDETEGIKNGSVLTLQFRTSREIHMIDLRTNAKGVLDQETGEDVAHDVRWLYESGSLDKLDSLELGEDGWYTLKYTFTTEVMRTDKKLPDYETYYYTNLLMNFAGYLMEGDVLEVKNAFLDGQALPLRETEDNKILATTSTSSMETVEAHDWTIPKTYAIVYAQGGEWRSDAGVPVEAVAAGGLAKGVPATNGFTASYTYGDAAFDLSTAINSDLILSYTLTPVQWTVTFDTKGGSEMQPKQVTHGTKLSLTNEELPTYPTYEFLGWFLDSDCTQEFDLATETITGNITLYAGWAQNVRHVTIDLDNAEGTDDVSVKNVVDGGTVTASWFDTPINPGLYFAGWFVGDVAFNPATYGPVTADITVKAHWTEPDSLYAMEAEIGTGDKFILSWEANTCPAVKGGDIIAFKFRSTATFDQFSVRNSSKKWAYEKSLNGTNLLVYEVGDDGWTSVAYKFTAQGGNFDDDGGAIDYGDNGLRFRFDLRATNSAGGILVGDILEVKGISLNGVELELTAMGTASGYVTDDFDADVDLYNWPATVNMTYNYDNGGAADPRSVPSAVEFGKKASLTLPEDTSKGGLAFMGWYKDSGYTEAFDSNIKITEDTIVYGRWIEAFTVTLHQNNGEDDKVIYVDKNLPMDEPRGVGKPGYLLAGWYEDSELTDDWTFASDSVDDNLDLYAKWIDPSDAYQFTVTKAESRFQMRWTGDVVDEVGLKDDIQPGDVLTLMIMFPAGNSRSEYYWRLRTVGGEAHITENTNFSSTTKDGNWYLIKATVPNTIIDGQGIYLQVYGASESNWAVNDKMIIKGFAVNGKEIPIDARAYNADGNNHDHGAYSKVNADCVAVNLDGSPKT